MKPLSRQSRRRLRAFAAAVVAILAGLAVVLSSPDKTRHHWRELAIDVLLGLSPLDVPKDVVLVDIDQKTIDAIGPWPWSRNRIADLISAVSDGVPRVIALDILLEGPDRASPEVLSKRFPEGTLTPELRDVIAGLPDPDEYLAISLSSVPTVLGFLLNEAEIPELASTPILMAGTPPTLAPWTSRGALLPFEKLRAEATSIGSSSLAGDVDGLIRRVPLFVVAGESVQPGLSIEIARLGNDAGSYILGETTVGVGPYSLPLVPTADLRFRPVKDWGPQHVSVNDLLQQKVDPKSFENKLVLIGGSAPALGALRATAAGPVTPSLQIQGAALATIMSGRVPYQPAWSNLAELSATAMLAVAGAIAGACVGPVLSALLGLLLAIAWVAGCAVFLHLASIVLDPVLPTSAILLAVVVSATVMAVETRRVATEIRRRFEQHLAPSVVARIAETPGLLKLEGERRDVTALFTDIEGFTAVVDRIGPADLVKLLDRYFAGVTGIIVGHGGMVDKIVGDAVHALFNAPVDLPDHARHAVLAAIDIIEFSQTFARQADVAAFGLGRTRIGIETGDAIVGDVGSGQKLDYTAHGNAVNTASRLEALNKTFGSSICVGPVCRAAITGMDFRLLGTTEIRGRGVLSVYEPALGATNSA